MPSRVFIPVCSSNCIEFRWSQFQHSFSRLFDCSCRTTTGIVALVCYKKTFEVVQVDHQWSKLICDICWLLQLLLPWKISAWGFLSVCSGAMLQDCIGRQREFYSFYIATCFFIVLEEAFERYQCVQVKRAFVNSVWIIAWTLT